MGWINCFRRLSLHPCSPRRCARGTLKFVSYKGSDKSNANFKGHFDRDVATTTPIYAYAQYPNVYNQADAIVNDLHFQTGKLTGEGSATTHDVLFATGTYDPNATEPLALTFQRKMARAA